MKGLLKRIGMAEGMRNIVLLRLLFVMANALGPFAALFFQRHYQLDSSAVALVITLMSAFYLLGNLLGGVLIGRCSFRVLLICTSSCSSVFLLFAALFSSSIASIVMVLLFMLCAGLITPVFSVLTSLAADESNRVANFGYLHLASNLGGRAAVRDWWVFARPGQSLPDDFCDGRECVVPFGEYLSGSAGTPERRT
ncbi:MFS transporter [Pseudomonas sp. Sample_10]|uniref:MFS transporter n=1 Tax=Pseudomonas sp. Sample_10 TaxID=2448269 RepID=UPI001F4F1D4B|nr:MFS transporter [Pseudomonas sp. Sample_10]